MVAIAVKKIGEWLNYFKKYQVDFTFVDSTLKRGAMREL